MAGRNAEGYDLPAVRKRSQRDGAEQLGVPPVPARSDSVPSSKSESTGSYTGSSWGNASQGTGTGRGSLMRCKNLILTSNAASFAALNEALQLHAPGIRSAPRFAVRPRVQAAESPAAVVFDRGAIGVQIVSFVSTACAILSTIASFMAPPVAVRGPTGSRWPFPTLATRCTLYTARAGRTRPYRGRAMRNAGNNGPSSASTRPPAAGSRPVCPAKSGPLAGPPSSA